MFSLSLPLLKYSNYLKPQSRHLQNNHDNVNKSISIVIKETERKINTHKYIVKTSINVLLNDIKHSILNEVSDKESQTKIENFFKDNLRNILRGSADPDRIENDSIYGVPSFSGHFFDPDTRLNYKNQLTPTAFTRFVEHSKTAKKLYEDGNPRFALELGRALHYLGDAGEPHHASNKIAFISNHLSFEHYAKLIKTSANLKSGEYYYSFCPIKLWNDTSFEKYCEKIILYTSRYAKSFSKVDSYRFSIKYGNLQDNNKNRKISLYNIDENEFLQLNMHIKNSIIHCQNITSAFLFNFIKSIKLI